VSSLLTTHSLACGYSAAPILSGLELQVRGGRFVCIIGPNGAGKTTLVRTLAGLLSPVAGEVLVSGSPVHRLD
jgi:iron complex transport system ATP-binding protein